MRQWCDSTLCVRHSNGLLVMGRKASQGFCAGREGVWCRAWGRRTEQALSGRTRGQEADMSKCGLGMASD